MKKFLALSLLLGSAVAFVPAGEAKAAEKTAAISIEANAAPQINIRIGKQRNRRARVVTRTRTVRVGRNVFREVVQYRYRPNGSVTTRVISRTRIR